MKCFLIEETEDRHVEVMTSWGRCAKNPYDLAAPMHHARTTLFRGPEAQANNLFNTRGDMHALFHAICEYCSEDGGMLEPDGAGMGSIWVRRDTGQTEDNVRAFGVGALYYASWQHYGDRTDAQGRKLYGFDWDNLIEPPLHVVTPGGEWNIDSRASNCTLLNDKTHRCWVKHGQVPAIHVDKVGVTCGAGAGSIICGSYHGFLHQGSLTGSM